MGILIFQLVYNFFLLNGSTNVRNVIQMALFSQKVTKNRPTQSL